MPRDLSGNYTLPAGNPVVSGTVITTAWANPTMDDIAQALTDSLDRNGKGGMNVPLRFTDGTNAAPGIAWQNEPSTGFYRAGTNDMRCAVAGVDKFRSTATKPLQFWDGTQWNDVFSNGQVEITLGTAGAVIKTDDPETGQIILDPGGSADTLINSNLQVAGSGIFADTVTVNPDDASVYPYYRLSRGATMQWEISLDNNAEEFVIRNAAQEPKFAIEQDGDTSVLGTLAISKTANPADFIQFYEGATFLGGIGYDGSNVFRILDEAGNPWLSFDTATDVIRTEGAVRINRATTGNVNHEQFYRSGSLKLSFGLGAADEYIIRDSSGNVIQQVAQNGDTLLAGQTTIEGGTGEALRLRGNPSLNPSTFIGFYGADGATRFGFVGMPSSTNADMDFVNEQTSGQINIRAKDSGGTQQDAITINAFGNAGVQLLWGGFPRLQTQSLAAEGNTTGAQVRDVQGDFYDIGYNVLPLERQDASFTMEERDCGKKAYYNVAGTRTITTPASTDLGFPIGGVMTVQVLGATTVNIVGGAGVTLRWFNGSGAPVTGSRVVGQGGWITIERHSATGFFITGTGIS